MPVRAISAVPQPRTRARFNLALLLTIAALAATPAQAGKLHNPLPPPALDEPAGADHGTETAVLAGGCFWGVQAVFAHLRGVQQVVSGYTGGPADSANYEAVSSGATGHAESVRVIFDPHEITYGQILQVFFSVAHNPTERNRQGPDVGTQYRSAIFYQNETQQRIAEAYMAQLSTAKLFSQPLATRLAAAGPFYAAEPYHQDYAFRHPESRYIVYYDLPKLDALKASFPALWRQTPVMVSTEQATQ